MPRVVRNRNFLRVSLEFLPFAGFAVVANLLSGFGLGWWGATPALLLVSAVVVEPRKSDLHHDPLQNLQSSTGA